MFAVVAVICSRSEEGATPRVGGICKVEELRLGVGRAKGARAEIPGGAALPSTDEKGEGFSRRRWLGGISGGTLEAG